MLYHFFPQQESITASIVIFTLQSVPDAVSLAMSLNVLTFVFFRRAPIWTLNWEGRTFSVMFVDILPWNGVDFTIPTGNQFHGTDLFMVQEIFTWERYHALQTLNWNELTRWDILHTRNVISIHCELKVLMEFIHFTCPLTTLTFQLAVHCSLTQQTL
jgi:hypothetical protein